DAPGIQFAPGNYQAVQGFLKYDPGRPGVFDATGVARIEDGRYVRNLFGKAIAQPAFLAGDIAIFTNWAIHATHWTEAMAKPRQSIECRFASARFNFPSCVF
ncbi:MAG TPA: hypothetical protein VMU42_15585, partial [Candidatus Sulfotelmatobacter sp.]|nr:hypothetical protein [Candidatus Sulfotelmatobacter sp.]